MSNLNNDDFSPLEERITAYYSDPFKRLWVSGPRPRQYKDRPRIPPSVVRNALVKEIRRLAGLEPDTVTVIIDDIVHIPNSFRDIPLQVKPSASLNDAINRAEKAISFKRLFEVTLRGVI